MGYDLFYWRRKGKNTGNAELDFIIQYENKIIPIVFIQIISNITEKCASLNFIF